MSVIRTFGYQSPDYKKALALRYKILRIPLGLVFTEEELKKDEKDVHVGLFDGENILACLILTDTGDGRIKMRQVAVDDGAQRQGLGRQISDFAEKFALENGFQVIFCNARKVAAPFYEKLGYKIVSDEFTEVKIPHYTMEKLLK